MKKQLIDKFENRDALIAVIGLGYVGLPLAVAFAGRGFTVVGIDSNQERVRTINVEMKSYIDDVPMHLERSFVFGINEAATLQGMAQTARKGISHSNDTYRR